MLRQDFCDYHFHWSPLFLFLSPLIICLSSRFVFWNTWSSRDREVLQSSPSSSLILFLQVCFFGSLVLVVVLGVADRCNHNDATKKIKKRNNTHTKKQGQTNTCFPNTEKHPLLCVLWFLGSEAGLLWFSESFLPLVLSWLFSLFVWFLCLISWFSMMLLWCLLYSWVVFCGWFSSLSSSRGCFELIVLITVNKISWSGKYHNTSIL